MLHTEETKMVGNGSALFCPGAPLPSSPLRPPLHGRPHNSLRTVCKLAPDQMISGYLLTEVNSFSAHLLPFCSKPPQFSTRYTTKTNRNEPKLGFGGDESEGKFIMS
jgi:hypothetical protein